MQGKVAVITGASAGIGEHVARKLAALGAQVVLAARRLEPLERVAAAITAAGGEALCVPTDIGDDDACAALLDAAVARFGRVDVVVNNAALHHRGAFLDHSAAVHAKMVDLNLRSPILLSRLALPHLQAAGGGAIVNVASLAGCVPLPGSVTYSATKFGLRAFSRALAEEVADQGITVSVVSPGPVATGFILDELETVTDLTLSQPVSTPEEVADDVVACVLDGKLERKRPAMSGRLTTVGYLWPKLAQALRPALKARGARRRKELLAKKGG